jgi:DNA replication protein DnaC
MSMTTNDTEVAERIVDLLGTFKLPTLSQELIPKFKQAGREDVLPLLLDVLELEESDRRERRTDRLRRASRLPPAKTLATLETAHFPRTLMQQIRELSKGTFLDKAINVLAFGRPGVGKSHASCAIGQRDTRFSLRRHISSCRSYSRRSVLSSYPVRCGSSTRSSF